MGCPGVRLEALQRFGACLKLSRPAITSMISGGSEGGRVVTQTDFGRCQNKSPFAIALSERDKSKQKKRLFSVKLLVMIGIWKQN